MMGKLLEGYRTAIRMAHPLRRRDANFSARLTVYQTLFGRWGSERVFRHFKAVMAVLDRAFDEAA